MLNRKIDENQFALAVVSGNPARGNSPEETAKNALQLYLTAVKVAKELKRLMVPCSKLIQSSSQSSRVILAM